MGGVRSTGTCALCGGSFSRLAMTRHLAGCAGPKIPGQSLHVVVEANFTKVYWLHVAVPVEAKLRALDKFLRRIWLECCCHLSAFQVGPRRYNSEGGGMNRPAGSILQAGMSFRYEYDFGSTTELRIKVVGVREHGTEDGKTLLLARNDDPQVPCERCGGAPATHICTECAEDGWMCRSCAEADECGDLDECLPVVNSPRSGVCGYSG